MVGKCLWLIIQAQSFLKKSTPKHYPPATSTPTALLPSSSGGCSQCLYQADAGSRSA